MDAIEDAGLHTRLVHADEGLNATAAVSPPIYQTSTYRLDDLDEAADLAGAVAPSEFYTRYGSPNTKQAEALVADLEQGETALVLGSGMAAITSAVLSNVAAGDHVVAQRTHYTATLSLLDEILPRYGVEVTQVDQRDPTAFEQAVRADTRVVYTESPANPTLALTDLAATATIAHEVGALAITDNTFATPFNQRPLTLGCDLVVHSATKYLNGHADVTAGAVVGDAGLVARAWEHARLTGPVLHPFEAWLLVRGLRTFGLRMAAHNDHALQVARFLDGHPAVATVHHPGLPGHPQHELARRQMPGGFGGMVSFELEGGRQAAHATVQSTRLCVPAVSLGGIETLITHPASLIFAHQSDEAIAEAGIATGLVRLSVGVEDPEDVIADLEQALPDREREH